MVSGNTTLFLRQIRTETKTRL